jgi:hypothetical protein
MLWFNNIDVDTFFPRNYDFKEEDEIEDFYTDFKLTKA